MIVDDDCQFFVEADCIWISRLQIGDLHNGLNLTRHRLTFWFRNGVGTLVRPHDGGVQASSFEIGLLGEEVGRRAMGHPVVVAALGRPGLAEALG